MRVGEGSSDSGLAGLIAYRADYAVAEVTADCVPRGPHPPTPWWVHWQAFLLALLVTAWAVGFVTGWWVARRGSQAQRRVPQEGPAEELAAPRPRASSEPLAEGFALPFEAISQDGSSTGGSSFRGRRCNSPGSTAIERIRRARAPSWLSGGASAGH